jgi:hypothetical protein
MLKTNKQLNIVHEIPVVTGNDASIPACCLYTVVNLSNALRAIREIESKTDI